MAAENVFRRRQGVLCCFANDGALARRQAVGLDHDGRPTVLDIGLGLSKVGKFFEGRGGNIVPLAQVFGEDFRAFQDRRPRRGTKGQDLLRIKAVNQTGYQGALRSDDDEIDCFRPAIGDDTVKIIDRDISAFGQLRYAAVTGRAA